MVNLINSFLKIVDATKLLFVEIWLRKESGDTQDSLICNAVGVHIILTCVICDLVHLINQRLAVVDIVMNIRESSCRH
jgi:hypothetical protein